MKVHQSKHKRTIAVGRADERKRIIKLIRTYFEDSREYERSIGQDLVRRILEK